MVYKSIDAYDKQPCIPTRRTHMQKEGGPMKRKKK